MIFLIEINQLISAFIEKSVSGYTDVYTIFFKNLNISHHVTIYFIIVQHASSVSLGSFNEGVLLIHCYRIIIFTDITTRLDSQVITIQYSYLILIVSLVLINLFSLFYNTVSLWKIKISQFEKKIMERKSQRNEQRQKMSKIRKTYRRTATPTEALSYSEITK